MNCIDEPVSTAALLILSKWKVEVMFRKSISKQAWEEWVERVVLHVPHYLSADGSPTSGGRQRKVRDVANLVTKVWGRSCVIVQKGSSNWERVDSAGNQVIGLKAPLSVYGDPVFGLKTSCFLREGDGIIYMGGEDAWPFFVDGAKGYHVGVWWDGPHSVVKKWPTWKRSESFFERCRTVLCCDANVINWLRTRDGKFQAAANRAVYLPNCFDEKVLKGDVKERREGEPLVLLFARRYEKKRGGELVLDALCEARRRGLNVRLLMSTAEGQDGGQELRRAIASRGMEKFVDLETNSLDSVYAVYQKCHAVIVPTVWSEGTSYSCIEGIAAGRPIITTNVGGLSNIVVPGFNGFATAPIASELANSIEALFDADLYETMSRNCLSMREAFSKISWDSKVLKWLKS